MDAPKKTIELDGRRYDAETGKPLDGKAADPANKPAKVIHDMVGPDRPPSPLMQAMKPKPAKPARHLRHRAQSTPAISRKPQRSSTLMRPAVSKPVHKAKAGNQKPLSLAASINKKRLSRAKAVAKSDKIKRFHHTLKPASAIKPRAEKLAVKEQNLPSTEPKRQEAGNDWPILDQFEKAVQEASSHLETFADNAVRRKNRKLSYVFITLAIILVAGFSAYALIPSAKIKMAGNKAGFQANLPNSPSGFGLSDPIQADYGKVTLSYKSRTDDKGFKLTQAPSQWNSQALISNFLSSHQDYQTVRGGGRTIYTYENSNATWVDGGIWYKVEGNVHLSNDQLLKLADSL